MTNNHAHLRRSRSRGSIYVLVLSVGLLLAVMGIGMLTTAQLNLRTGAQSNDIAKAEALAQAAVEYGLSVIQADTNWRTTYTSGTSTAESALGDGFISFKLVDETDGSLSNNSVDAARLYGKGRVRNVVRVYSVLLIGKGTGLDVLRTVAHGGSAVQTQSTVSGTGGAFSSNTTFTVSSGSTLNGDVEAPSVVKLGTINGTVTSSAPPKTMPPAAVFDYYRGLATSIAYSSFSGGGTMQGKLLSATSNPYGSPNPSAVYYIRVPSSQTLTIRQSRIVAVLLIELDSGATVRCSNGVLFEAPRPDYPVLLIKGGASSTVDLTGGGAFSEGSAGANLNPEGTPYAGVSDNDTLDTYPDEVTGLVHVIGTKVSTTTGNGYVGKGTIISDGTLTISNSANLQIDPDLYKNPPPGYMASVQMVPASGSWRWEKAQ